ncbi:ABC transporter ATP-binding protein [Dictyobacter aurantiacus]|uniref:Helicase n=1 Tax=Dictyobacter aurantiacus TaxID=1936993 RepID=A0A401ZB81_9CHLR|nr:ABC transporter ATP-binding protein [Dictyobacter aurantiacus]GCE04013.1 helicase [Dictyobacter aurantiacus]
MSTALKDSFTYRELLTLYLGPQWRRVCWLILLLLGGIILQLINPQILRQFIDSAMQGADITPLMLAGALFMGLSLLNQALAVINTYVSENVAWTATNQLRTDLVRHCLQLDMAFHKARTSGELIERIDGDVNTLATFFSQAIVRLFGNGLLIIGVLLLLFKEQWQVGIAISLFALGGLLILVRIRRVAIPYWMKTREKDAEFFGFLGEQLAGTEDLRANGATGYVMTRFYQILRSWLPINIRASLASYGTWGSTLLLFGIGNALALGISIYLWSRHELSPGGVYLIFYYTNLLSAPMEQIRTQLQQLQEAGAGIERIRQLLQAQPTILDGSGPDLPAGALELEINDLTFGYNPDEPVLQGISLQLAEGRVLGVLGRTGSGKTTLARLLLRLYEPQQGEILLGGVPLRQTRLSDLRQHIGMVTQDVQLFHATVRDNLTYFNRAIADKRIIKVLSQIGLVNWYKNLPEGLDTILGSDGEGLSAGEAQLLAFTRVFLSDPGLIIMDEASSRLDPATEQLIERAVDTLLSNRTGIIIAHRLGTIQRADDILIIENGRILEYGPRARLAADPQSRFYQLLQTGLEEVLA